jgi:hypothetical protein
MNKVAEIIENGSPPKFLAIHELSEGEKTSSNVIEITMKNGEKKRVLVYKNRERCNPLDTVLVDSKNKNKPTFGTLQHRTSDSKVLFALVVVLYLPSMLCFPMVDFGKLIGGTCEFNDFKTFGVSMDNIPASWQKGEVLLNYTAQVTGISLDLQNIGDSQCFRFEPRFTKPMTSDSTLNLYADPRNAFNVEFELIKWTRWYDGVYDYITWNWDTGCWVKSRCYGDSDFDEVPKDETNCGGQFDEPCSMFKPVCHRESGQKVNGKACIGDIVKTERTTILGALGPKNFMESCKKLDNVAMMVEKENFYVFSAGKVTDEFVITAKVTGYNGKTTTFTYKGTGPGGSGIIRIKSVSPFATEDYDPEIEDKTKFVLIPPKFEKWYGGGKKGLDVAGKVMVAYGTDAGVHTLGVLGDVQLADEKQFENPSGGTHSCYFDGEDRYWKRNVMKVSGLANALNLISDVDTGYRGSSTLLPANISGWHVMSELVGNAYEKGGRIGFSRMKSDTPEMKMTAELNMPGMATELVDIGNLRITGVSGPEYTIVNLNPHEKGEICSKESDDKGGSKSCEPGLIIFTVELQKELTGQYGCGAPVSITVPLGATASASGSVIDCQAEPGKPEVAKCSRKEGKFSVQESSVQFGSRKGSKLTFEIYPDSRTIVGSVLVTNDVPFVPGETKLEPDEACKKECANVMGSGKDCSASLLKKWSRFCFYKQVAVVTFKGTFTECVNPTGNGTHAGKDPVNGGKDSGPDGQFGDLFRGILDDFEGFLSNHSEFLITVMVIIVASIVFILILVLLRPKTLVGCCCDCFIELVEITQSLLCCCRASHLQSVRRIIPNINWRFWETQKVKSEENEKMGPSKWEKEIEEESRRKRVFPSVIGRLFASVPSAFEKICRTVNMHDVWDELAGSTKIDSWVNTKIDPRKRIYLDGADPILSREMKQFWVFKPSASWQWFKNRPGFRYRVKVRKDGALTPYWPKDKKLVDPHAICRKRIERGLVLIKHLVIGKSAIIAQRLNEGMVFETCMDESYEETEGKRELVGLLTEDALRNNTGGKVSYHFYSCVTDDDSNPHSQVYVVRMDTKDKKAGLNGSYNDGVIVCRFSKGSLTKNHGGVCRVTYRDGSPCAFDIWGEGQTTRRNQSEAREKYNELQATSRAREEMKVNQHALGSLDVGWPYFASQYGNNHKGGEDGGISVSYHLHLFQPSDGSWSEVEEEVVVVKEEVKKPELELQTKFTKVGEKTDDDGQRIVKAFEEENERSGKGTSKLLFEMLDKGRKKTGRRREPP